MKASIIIPVFNGSRFLRETVRSALRQSYRDIEIIIVDDGSTDDTPAVCHALRESNPRVVRYWHQQNAGPSAARNTGLQLSRGEFVQFLDADDLLAAEALTRRIEALSAHDVDIVTSHWQSLVENECGRFQCDHLEERTWQQFAADVDTALIKGYWCPPAAWTMRRSARIKRVRFNTTMTCAEDVRFLFDAVLAGARIGHLESCLAWHRRTVAPSLSRRCKVEFARGVAANALYADFYWRMREALTPERKLALLDVYDYVARALYRGDPQLFDQVVLHMLSLRRLRFTWPHIVGRLSPLIGHVGAGQIADAAMHVKQRLSLRGAPQG